MKRIIIWIIILSVSLWAFDHFIGNSKQDQLSDEDLPTFKGKIYIPPKGAPFEEFFMDQTGQIYKLNLEQVEKEIIEETAETIEEVKGATAFVEIKGNVKQSSGGSGQKEIIVKEITKQETIKEEIIEKETFVCPPCVCD